MLTSMDMYWLTRLDSLNNWIGCVFIISTIVGLVVGSVGAMFADTCDNLSPKDAFRWARRILLMSLIFGGLGVMVPTTKEMVAIYVVPALANNEQVRSIPDTALKLADEYLKQKLDELTSEKHNK